MDSGFQPA